MRANHKNKYIRTPQFPSIHRIPTIRFIIYMALYHTILLSYYTIIDKYIPGVMEEETECQLRRRRLSANPKIPTEFEVSFQVDEGGPDLGTPSPGSFKTKRSLSDAMIEFKNKQQSFDIQVYRYSIIL